MHSVTSNAVAYLGNVLTNQLSGYNTTSTYPSVSIQSEIRTQFNNTAQYNEFKGKSMASEEGAWWGYRHSNYGSGIFISRGDVVAFYLDTYGTFESKYIFRR